MATFTVSSFLYFTQNLRREALRASRAWLEFDFDQPGVGLEKMTCRIALRRPASSLLDPFVRRGTKACGGERR
jgi:hypothetical protein